MKRILAIALAALPVFACTTETIIQKAPPTEVQPTAEEPTEESSATEPTKPAVKEENLPANPACACPTTCKSPADADKLVCYPHKAPDELSGGQTIGKYQIQGYEYWQWKKGKDVYGDNGSELAWGYNGDKGETEHKPSEPSRRCMAEARKVLSELLAKDVPAELDALREAKKTSKFWNWNNDLTDAAADIEISSNYDGLWLFQGTRSDGGLIKWISATERDGTCRLPTREDLVTFAKSCLTTHPKCGSGKPSK